MTATTTAAERRPRMKNPALIFPDAMRAVKLLQDCIDKGGVAPATLALVHLRISQINGCAPCLQMGAAQMRHEGESENRMATVAAWREAPYFDDAERAALDLAEAVTRLADRPDPVPDAIWDEAARHYDETGLAALLLEISITNIYNRFNVTTRQVAGSWS